ncbi:MAG TPA: DUF3299 domain-containing protein [Planctomycetaceae bacterium]|nr:DUF3299 domain-containing protein [Planctomycetaceae bacterium]
MSQSTVTQPEVLSGQPLPTTTASSTNEFGYRPVPLLAPLSFFLGLVSALGFLGLLVIPIGLVGIIVAGICILRLRKARGEYGGMWLAVSGFVMSLVFFSSSAGIWAYGYRTEVPEGYRRLNFTDDISNKGFAITKGNPDIFNPDVKALDGKQVFIKGYMYPTNETRNLKTFLLVKDNAQCCFGGNPKINDMILVTMKTTKGVDYHQGLLMSIGGTFHCQKSSGPAGLMPVYAIDGTIAEGARTIF